MTDKIKLRLKKSPVLHSLIATRPNYLTLLRVEVSKIILLVTTHSVVTVVFFAFFADTICSVVRLLALCESYMTFGAYIVLEFFSMDNRTFTISLRNGGLL